MEDFQSSILPRGQGKDCLIIGQNLGAAKQHILDLKKMIRSSEKYRGYMIDAPSEILFEEEQTKAYVIYIRNISNPYYPSRIIGLGSSIPSVWSWKKVFRMHFSDVAELDMVEEKQDEFFSTAFSRVIITHGAIKIETPPAGQQGFIFRLVEKVKKMEKERLAWNENKIPRFKLFEYPATLAIKYGVMTQQDLDDELEILGPQLYSAKYECNFLSAGNQFFNQKWQTERWITN